GCGRAVHLLGYAESFTRFRVKLKIEVYKNLYTLFFFSPLLLGKSAGRGYGGRATISACKYME
ncbi:hypothetical protein, partial [Gottfriedia acidiceleris]|uniref:hypothetical protein n=1 Tax=Gottfriedia acidiceleris TaxID=371036 RepID=UPI00197AFA14